VKERFGEKNAGDPDDELEFLNDGLQVDDKNFWSNESSEMKYLKYLYHEAHTNEIDKEAAYIFVIGFAERPEVQGDMPRGKQTGYVFCDTEETFSDGHLIAHELGHGIYGLEHTFATGYGVPQGSTNNLMDYVNNDFLASWQWKIIANPMIVWNFLEGDEDGMKGDVNYFGQKIVRPNGYIDRIQSDAVCVLNEKEQTIAFLVPDEKIFYWVNNQTATGYFLESGVRDRDSYGWYVTDKMNREKQPISWGIYLAAYDLGQFAIDFGTSPLETTTNFAKGIWKIATLDFDIAKTWDRVINADLTDASYVVSTVLICQLAGPKGKNLVAETDVPRFGEFLGEVTTQATVGGSKMTWQQVLVLFQKAKVFESSVSQHLLKLYPVEQGYKIFNQVYLKVDGVTSIADNLIYNTKTNKFILNETKYGTSNTLRKNQKVLQDAIKAGKEIEIRSVNGLEGTSYIYTNKITTIEEIIRSHSIDGTITNNTIRTIWKK
jgi:hypothetical protein